MARDGVSSPFARTLCTSVQLCASEVMHKNTGGHKCSSRKHGTTDSISALLHNFLGKMPYSACTYSLGQGNVREAKLLVCNNMNSLK
jgi:hypothetical protein